MSAASRPIRNPPLHRACNPFERSAIVAYKPFADLSNGGETLVGDRLRGDARIVEQRPAPAQAAGANFEAAYSAPSDDAPARKFRRENEFEKLFMGISKNLEEAYWFHCHRAIRF